MTTSAKEIDFPGDDDAVGTATAATVAPAEPEVDPSVQPDSPDCPTHTHEDNTVHPGIQCSGGCPR